MLNFDLNQNPPTAEEIAEARQTAVKWRNRLAALFLTLSMTALATSGVFALDTASTMESAAAFIAAIVFALLMAAMFDRSGRSGVLSDIAPSDCEQFVADCLAAPECEAYRQKVAALGRKPVKAEATMIREVVVRDWALAAGREKERLAREKERREGIACALVASKEPLSSDAANALIGEQPC